MPAEMVIKHIKAVDGGEFPNSRDVETVYFAKQYQP